MQNKRELKKELNRCRKQQTAILKAIDNPKWTPAEIDPMEGAANQYAENIDLVESLLGG